MRRWFMKRKRKVSASDMSEEKDNAASQPTNPTSGELPSQPVNHTLTFNHINHTNNVNPDTRDVSEVFASNLKTIDTERGFYDDQKQRLLQREREVAWDRPARNRPCQFQNEADEIVWKIREDERDNLFGNKASEAIPGPETLDMGGQFLTNRDRITDESNLFKIAKRVPKGCHLHLHFNAELTPIVLIDKADIIPQMHIRSTQPILSLHDLAETEIAFDVKPVDTLSVDVFASDYRPDFRSPGSQPWMLWSDFKSQFAVRAKEFNQSERDHTRHVTADVKTWVKDKMVLSAEEAYNPAQTTNGVWARFNQATRAFKGLVNYESIHRWYLEEAIENFIRDRVMYAELRPMLMDKSIPSDDGARRLFHKDQMNILIDVVQRKQDQLRAKGELDKFPFGMKIIYCAPRSIPKTMMQQEIKDCMRLHLEYPELICGFDLVGAEDRANHIGYYRDELLAMVKTCKDLNIEIPFMFHAGETLLDLGGSKNPDNSNLYDAVILNAKRIGHGYSLLKHPVLVEEFKKKGICIELCPTSNELLHLCRNVKEHPYPEMLAAGLECTINSDNPSLFRNSVSYEFYQVMVGSPTMSIHGWRQLTEWSVKHSRLSDDEKKQAMQILAREWETFCKWVVEKYGEHASKLTVTM